MKKLGLKISTLAILTFLTITNYGYAQKGHIEINQDKKIEGLLEAKKEMNKNETSSDRYKIQIYNGDRSGANSAKSNFNQSFPGISSIVEFEPPNFKTWIGNYITRLEADRALRKVKEKFPNAFIFKPKKDKDD